MAKEQSLQDLKSFITLWTLKFPLDYWWRKKYGVSFNSEVHRNSCFIDQKVEYEEEIMFKRLYKARKKEMEDEEDYLSTGRFLRPKRESVTQKQIDDSFDDINLKELNALNNKLKPDGKN